MNDSTSLSDGLNCPIPINDYPKVLMAHGGGGKLMQQLIEMFVGAFGHQTAKTLHDGAVMQWAADALVMTTDSYVVNPLFFPGGDIGSLAVYGTVNDLAMCAAQPYYLSVGFILEEGLPMETLWRVVQSMKQAADRCGVALVTGDTKVVDQGKGDGIFINTTGVGIPLTPQPIHPSQIQEGDVIIVNGDVGRHGMAILAQREGLQFESELESDCAPLNVLVRAVIERNIPVHALRDATRGGLASVLIELAATSDNSFEIDESQIPLCDPVRGACELLGLDPLYVACEGRFVIFVPEDAADATLKVLQQHESGHEACVIGRVTDNNAGEVILKTAVGSKRRLDLLSGDQLPRIC